MRGPLELLVPLLCPGCAAPVGVARGVCARCRRRMAALALPGGAPELLGEDVLAVGGWAYAGVVAQVVRGMKAGERWAAAPALGRALRERLGLPSAREAPTTWVPAPRARARRRGFDLPRLLAGPGARALLATSGTRPEQSSLDPDARRTLAADMFHALAPTPRAVILIDDVRTTGATVLAAATALRHAGTERVLVVTLAVAGQAALVAAGSREAHW